MESSQVVNRSPQVHFADMSTETPTRDTTSAHVGIVYANPIEIAPLIRLCDRRRKYTTTKFVFTGGFYGDLRVAFVECGMGTKTAAEATQLLIEGHRPKLVISTGFAGGLQDQIQRFDFVHVDSLVTESASLPTDVNSTSAGLNAEPSQDSTAINPVPVPPSLSPDPAHRLHVGRVLTVDHIVRTAAEKRALGERYQALAVDMESAAVWSVTQAEKIPFVGLRVISDDVRTELPPEVLSVVGASGALRLGAALASVWKRPSSVKEMWNLREIATEAGERLCRFLAGLLEQLPVEN